MNSSNLSKYNMSKSCKTWTKQEIIRKLTNVLDVDYVCNYDKKYKPSVIATAAYLSKLSYKCDSSNTQSYSFDNTFQWNNDTISEQVDILKCYNTYGKLAVGVVFAIGVSSNNLYVSWRGSSFKRNFSDIYTDLYGQLRNINIYNNIEGDSPRVHNSVYKLYIHHRVEITNTIIEYLHIYKSNHVTFCGHSLGGALALINLYDIQQILDHQVSIDGDKYGHDSINTDTTIDAITLGSIPIGNKSFVDTLTKHNNIIQFRNEGDGFSKIFVMAGLNKNAMAMVVSSEDDHIECEENIHSRCVSNIFPYFVTTPFEIWNLLAYYAYNVRDTIQNGYNFGMRRSKSSKCDVNSYRIENKRYLHDEYARVYSNDQSIDIFTRTKISDENLFSFTDIGSYIKNHSSTRYYQEVITGLKLYLECKNSRQSLYTNKYTRN
jgi:hypothetical protein